VLEGNWNYTAWIRMIRQLMGGRMCPLTREGLDSAMQKLVRYGRHDAAGQTR
jgi:hypothetical protein